MHCLTFNLGQNMSQMILLPTFKFWTWSLYKLQKEVDFKG